MNVLDYTPPYEVATLREWDPQTFANLLDWNGETVANVPVLGTLDELGWQAGDQVAVLRRPSPCIVARVWRPSVSAP